MGKPTEIAGLYLEAKNSVVCILRTFEKLGRQKTHIIKLLCSCYYEALHAMIFVKIAALFIFLFKIIFQRNFELYF